MERLPKGGAFVALLRDGFMSKDEQQTFEMAKGYINEAERQWNQGADEFNQWDSLDEVERVAIIIQAATLAERDRLIELVRSEGAAVIEDAILRENDPDKYLSCGADAIASLLERGV